MIIPREHSSLNNHPLNMCTMFKMEEFVHERLNALYVLSPSERSYSALWSPGTSLCEQHGKVPLSIILLSQSVILPSALSTFSLATSVIESVGV